MGLHKWIMLSKPTEENQTRTNLKKLGCLFESFIGALFLDFNKSTVNDDENLFQNLFLTGPGFQVVQIFIEQIFERHVDWIDLMCNDDNYKNILQVKIQKEFKVTPDYMEIEPYNVLIGYLSSSFIHFIFFYPLIFSFVLTKYNTRIIFSIFLVHSITGKIPRFEMKKGCEVIFFVAFSYELDRTQFFSHHLDLCLIQHTAALKGFPKLTSTSSSA